jgi:hypothetical protein
MRTTLSVLLTVASFLLLAVAVVPEAAAHTCRAENPQRSCGECLAGNHRHTYNNGTNYCTSSCSDAIRDWVTTDLGEEIDNACSALDTGLLS